MIPNLTLLLLQSILHRRMRVLQSRQGPRRATRTYAHMKAASRKMNLPSLTSPPLPCPPEKLLPPPELLTRERAFRYTYLKHHQPTTIPKISSLSRNEDPARDQILARIKAAEKLKREKDETMRLRAAAAEREPQAKAAVKEKSRLPRVGGGSSKGESDYQDTTSSSGRGQVDIPAVSPSQSPYHQRQSPWYKEDIRSSSEEESGEFAFLSQWSKSSKSKGGGRHKQMKKLPSLS